MKVQVKNFSTHQTAKVFAILMAASSLILIIPFSLLGMLAPTPIGAEGNTISSGAFSGIFLIMPIFQGIFGYIMMRLGLWIYNMLTPRIGGIEFDFEEVNL
ncbi:MAG: hypothetical protein OQK09_16025 [Colwellia sp.]|nr:hypothetical protein [Colwellia sp.]MCW8866545.1 hypothetical protein [Colwellia sp.]MCW9083016.1 hypothetical protein [Colwellia sp.]